MNAFESLVATILEREGFWVRTSFKVELTKEDKCTIRLPTSPRWELDVVGYRPGDNVLRVVECKSYLDSRGVTLAAFDPGNRHATRYKLFTNGAIREVVLNAASYTSIPNTRKRESITRNPAKDTSKTCGAPTA